MEKVRELERGNVMSEKNLKENKETEVIKREVTREPEEFVAPLTDIYEKEAGLKLVADLPGIAQDGLKLSVDKNVLTIEGRNRCYEVDNYLFKEYEPVNYFRQFELSKAVDQENIEAELKNGVLKVYLPFAKEVQPRVIEVKY